MIKRIHILFLILATITSCSDWLELKPPDDLVQDEYWQTKEDAEAVLMGAYAKFSSIDDKLLMYGELRADMIEPDNPSTSQRNIIEGNIEPTNTNCRWDDFYQVINQCNYVLEFSDLVKERDPTFTEFQKEGYKSEAIFLRSLSYFYLVRIFKDVPLVLNSSRTDNQDFFLPKSQDSLILSFIKKDLIQALTYTPDYYSSGVDQRGRATKSAIRALLADISLWQFDYESCLLYCDRIISTGDYPMVHGSLWFTLFFPGNTLESIFELQHDQGLGQPNALYDLTYLDQRFGASIYAQKILGLNEQWRTNGSFDPVEFTIWKYAGAAPDGIKTRSSSVLRDANLIIYRMADILLMKAEALNQMGRSAEAVALVNTIRERAQVTLAGMTSNISSTEDLILEERARELAFEGKRYFDLVRMGRRNDFQRKSVFIERIIQNVTPSQRYVLATKLTDPDGWYLPIHIDELEANINLEQNPYYESFTLLSK